MITKNIIITSTGKTVVGWEFAVSIKIKDEETGKMNEYNIQVQVDDTDYARLTSRTITPEEMVIKSVKFLLGRESAGQIMKTFNIMEIKKYYPDWEEMIKP